MSPREVAEQWVDFYNGLMGRAFRCSKQTIRSVGARMSDGATLDDMKLVTEWLKQEWTGTKLEKFLIPGTILRPTRWDERLDQAREWRKKREAAKAISAMRAAECVPVKPREVLSPEDLRQEAQRLLLMMKGR